MLKMLFRQYVLHVNRLVGVGWSAIGIQLHCIGVREMRWPIAMHWIGRLALDLPPARPHTCTWHCALSGNEHLQSCLFGKLSALLVLQEDRLVQNICNLHARGVSKGGWPLSWGGRPNLLSNAQWACEEFFHPSWIMANPSPKTWPRHASALNDQQPNWSSLRNLCHGIRRWNFAPVS